jgi:thioredoxin reductase (NADPH)
MLHPTFREHQVRLVGHRWSPRVHELKRFLGRSGVAYRWLDLEFDDPETKRILAELAEQPIAFPIVLLPDGSVLSDPDVHVLAERLGLPTKPADSLYDLVVIGAGPAGLAAAIHGASEGLHSVVVEKELPGGQASFSAAIENYPGFPRALDGSILARRTVEQAERFGVEFVMTRRATRLDLRDGKRVVTLDDGADLAARAVLIAIGVSFRWLDAPGCASLVGAGLYYGAATVEASACRGQDVYVLGGGNSAGQAALFLARYARSVHLLTPDDSLDRTMARYLIERIERTSNIVVHPHTTVAEAGGPGHVEWLVVRDTRTGELRGVPATALFVFIGAVPRSDWLDGRVDRDEDGFILSGLDYLVADPPDWPLGRRPYLLETRTPGVFVAGDVRKGSVKRLVVAAGEGAMAIQLIHQYLAEALADRAENRAASPAVADGPIAAASPAAVAASPTGRT